MNEGPTALASMEARLDARLARIEAALGTSHTGETLSVQEVSARRKRSVRHVYSLIKAGTLPTTGARPFRIESRHLCRVV